MLFYLSRGQRARNSDSAFHDGPASLQEAKLAAWALSVGEIRNPDGGRYRIQRPHRGQLPDVDFSLLAPDTSRRSLIRRLFGLVRRLSDRNDRKPGSAPSGQSPPLGERPPASYIGVTEAGDPSDFIRADATHRPELSRAA